MLFFKLFSRLPLGILYLFSDVLYLLARYVIRYRKRVIDDNLFHAFPEKTEKERKAIRNRFYRNFTDSIAETIKSITISKAELSKRFTITNQDLLDQEVKSGKGVLLLAGHFFNWELGLQQAAVLSKVPSEGVYLKINNPFFDKLMYQARTRFGNTITEKREFKNTVKTLGEHHRVVQLAADQRPNKMFCFENSTNLAQMKIQFLIFKKLVEAPCCLNSTVPCLWKLCKFNLKYLLAK